MVDDLVVVGLSGGRHVYSSIAQKLGARSMEIEFKRFPDGELYVRYPSDPKGTAVLVQSMYGDPNSKLVEYLLASKTAKELGAERVIGVVLYMAYARQDRRFRPGEAISIKIVADLMKHSGTDRLVVVDMHLHRVRGSELNDIFGIPISNLSAMPLLARHGLKFLSDPVFIGPDDEAIELARLAASVSGGKYTSLTKTRLSEREVKVSLKDELDIDGRDVMLVDDIISTGGTVVNAVNILKGLGARRVVVAVSHALLVERALERILACGVDKVFSSNTVPSIITEVDVSETVVEGLAEVI